MGGLICEEKRTADNSSTMSVKLQLALLVFGGRGVMVHKMVASKIVGGRGYKHGGQRDIYPEGGGATNATFTRLFVECFSIKPGKIQGSNRCNLLS